MEAKQDDKCANQQESLGILDSPSSGLRRIESSISASLVQSVDELCKLEDETRAFLESSTRFSPSQVNVVSLSEEKIVIEVQVS